MEWRNAKIVKAFIGIEDHGIFAWCLTFSGGAWSQATGSRGLCAESLPVIESIVRQFGPWNELEGKVVRVGREDRMIVAMRDIIDDNKEVHFT